MSAKNIPIIGRCDVCGRKPGYAPFNRFGEPDLNPDTPLGPLQQCESCKKFVCPDCYHETDCCFTAEWEAEWEDSLIPPRGWRREGNTFVRT